MFRVINEYIAQVNLISNENTYSKITDFLKEQADITFYDVKVNFNQYIIKITLKEYNVENAEKMFNKFNQENAYSHSEMHVRFNEGKCVRYRFITSNENKDAFYCDLIFN